MRKMYAVYTPDGLIRELTHTNAILTFDDVEGDLDIIEVDSEHVNGETDMVDTVSRRVVKRPPNKPPESIEIPGPPEPIE